MSTDLMLTLAVISVSGIIALFISRMVVDSERKGVRLLVATMVFAILVAPALWGLSHYLRTTTPDGEPAPQQGEDEPQQGALLATLKEEEPQVYQEILAKMRQDGSTDPQQLETLLRETYAPVLLRRLPRLGDTTLQQFEAIFLKQLKLLQERDPEQCFALLFPGNGVASDMALLRETTAQSGMDAMQIAILRDKTTPAAPPDAAAIQALQAQIRQDLHQRYGEKIVLAAVPEMAKTAEDRAFLCAATIDFYEALNDPGDPVKTALLRQILSPDAADSPTE
ncbi:MAG: hypothetical protein ACFN9G_07575 [Cardiobacterium sp.]|jgi:hypothetical protein